MTSMSGRRSKAELGRESLLRSVQGQLQFFARRQDLDTRRIRLNSETSDVHIGCPHADFSGFSRGERLIVDYCQRAGSGPGNPLEHELVRRGRWLFLVRGYADR